MKERIHLKKMGSFFCKKIAPTVLVTVGAVGIIYSVLPEVNVPARRYEFCQLCFVHVAFHFQPASVILDI